jgi:hypothetical protein
MSILLLLLGITSWFFIPILGIFPLLFWIQLKLLYNKTYFTNQRGLINLVLALIILTVSIFASSITVYTDVATYVRDYQALGLQDLFNLRDTETLGLYGSGYEIVLFILSYPTKLLSDNSGYWFLFNHSLLINSLTVLIAKRFSKSYYPLILVIIFSTFSYYHHVYLMRQFLANTFILLTILFIESKIWFYLFGILAFFSHMTSLMYILILWFVKVFIIKGKLFTKSAYQSSSGSRNLGFLNSTDRKYIVLSEARKKVKVGISKTLLVKILFIIFITVSSSLIASVFSGSANLNIISSVSLFRPILSRIEFYADDISSSGNTFRFLLITSPVIIYSILFRGKGANQFLLKDKVLIFIFAIQYSLILFFSNLRLSLLLVTYYGIFFSLLTESGVKSLRWLAWLISYLSILNLIRNFALMDDYPTVGGSLVFFEGNIFSKNLIDYLNFILKGQLN